MSRRLCRRCFNVYPSECAACDGTGFKPRRTVFDRNPSVYIIVPVLVCGVANLTATVMLHPPPLVTGGIGLVCGLVSGWQLALSIRKGKRLGTDRNPEADSHDPETSGEASSLTIGSITFSSSPSFSFSAAAGANVEEPKEEIERVESDLPILAHRSARLYLDGTSKCFGPVAQEGEHFGVDALARCLMTDAYYFSFGAFGSRPQRHDAPALSCSCGFYALPTDLAPTYEHHAYVTLMVELSGIVIEHEEGFRAEHQRVVECQIPPCPYCGDQADVVIVDDFSMQQAVCATHAPVATPGLIYVTVDDLSRKLPVPISRAGRRSGCS